MTTAKATIFFDASSAGLDLPVLLTERGIIEPLLRYQLRNYHRKSAWHKRLNFSVALLLEYVEANLGLLGQLDELFQRFALRLRDGTIDELGNDPTGLYWTGRRIPDRKDIVRHLTGLSCFLVKHYDGHDLNPLREANFSERMMKMAALQYKTDANFLGHLDSKANAWKAAGQVQSIGFEEEPNIIFDIPAGFPEELFPRFIQKGFLVNNSAVDPLDRLNVRDVLITLLLHAGGVRTSECFHLWTTDVTEHPEDPTVAWVRIGHPRLGSCDGNAISERLGRPYMTRANFLARQGLKPRDRTLGRLEAGWKNPALDRKYYLEVHWSDPEYGRLFLDLWRHYLNQIIDLNLTHPWAFVTLQGKGKGQPYPLSEFRHAYVRALKRIERAPNWSEGLHPHGHRHAYARRLKVRGCSDQTIKNCLHHNTLEAQRVYTEEELRDMNRELTEGYQRASQEALQPAVRLLSDFAGCSNLDHKPK